MADQERQRPRDHHDRDRDPDKTGNYQLICTELCGFGHASMRAKVVVQSQSEFDKWVDGLKEKVPTPLMVSVKQDTETNPEPLERVEAE